MSGVPRPEIPTGLADSWRRSMALGISPDQHSPRHLHDVADVLELRREHRLQQVMPAQHDLLADDSSSGRHLLVLTDARGEILWRVGSPEVLRRAGRLEFTEGAACQYHGRFVINGRNSGFSMPARGKCRCR